MWGQRQGQRAWAELARPRHPGASGTCPIDGGPVGTRPESAARLLPPAPRFPVFWPSAVPIVAPRRETEPATAAANHCTLRAGEYIPRRPSHSDSRKRKRSAARPGRRRHWRRRRRRRGKSRWRPRDQRRREESQPVPVSVCGRRGHPAAPRPRPPPPAPAALTCSAPAPRPGPSPLLPSSRLGSPRSSRCPAGPWPGLAKSIFSQSCSLPPAAPPVNWWWVGSCSSRNDFGRFSCFCFYFFNLLICAPSFSSVNYCFPLYTPWSLAQRFRVYATPAFHSFPDRWYGAAENEQEEK